MLVRVSTYSIKMRISLSFRRAFRNIDNILELFCVMFWFTQLSKHNSNARVELPLG